MWTVRFSRGVRLDDIEAITIQREQEFVPVRIGLGTTSNHIVVSPATSFSGNTRYELRVTLANGKRYKKLFYTVSENRKADKEPNNGIGSASTIELRETISGVIEKGDRDFYKVTVPEYGTLSLTAQAVHKKYFYFYQKQSTDWRYKSEDTALDWNIAVSPGTYYISISNWASNDLRDGYTLTTDFTPSVMSNDSADRLSISMEPIPFGTPIQGLVGYLNDKGGYNEYDYYKIVVPWDGYAQNCRQ